MDGFDTNAKVVVLGATNRRDLLDSALLRPGRFDRQIDIGLPDIEGRKEIFKIHLKPLKLTLSKENSLESLANRLATLTPGFSGADIQGICNEAAIHAARLNKLHVTEADFDSACEKVLAGFENKKVLSDGEK